MSDCQPAELIEKPAFSVFPRMTYAGHTRTPSLSLFVWLQSTKSEPRGMSTSVSDSISKFLLVVAGSSYRLAPKHKPDFLPKNVMKCCLL